MGNKSVLFSGGRFPNGTEDERFKKEDQIKKGSGGAFGSGHVEIWIWDKRGIL